MSNPQESLLAPITSLSGVEENAAATLTKILGIKNVADLARSPHFSFATEISEAATNPRHLLRRFGVPKGRVTKAFEEKPVDELAEAPVRVLAGISAASERALTRTLGVGTIKTLASWPPFRRAREILDAAVRGGTVAEEPKLFRVSGLVVRRDGDPVVGAKVKVLRQGIRRTTPLGSPNTVKTNANGGFIFEYERPDTPIDLRVELLADARSQVTETRPRVITQAGPDERVDLVVGDESFRGPSTFERLERSLAQALADEGVQPLEIAGFAEEELARLALKAGIDPRTLVLMRQSYALAKETKLPAEVFFGMGREKMLLSLPALLVQGADRRRAAVEAALAANHISARLQSEAARVLSRLDELTVEEALKTPTAPDRTTLGSLLDEAAIPAAKRKPLVDAYIKHTGTNEEFWKEVGTSGVLSTDEIGRLQFNLQLATVTQNHAPLVAALKARGISELKGLGTLEKEDWINLIKGDGNNQPLGLPADLKAAGLDEAEYAGMIFRIIEDALPTAMVEHRLDRFSNSEPLKRFFARNPDFDLRTTPVRTYLEANADALDFVASDAERQEVEKRLKGVERAYRIASPGARVETMEVLLRDGLDSAQKVRVLGRAAFLRRYEAALGREGAEKVWTRANNASALAAIVVARHSAMFDRTPIYVLPKRIEKLSNPFPSYEALFGSQDFCSCEHCESVFSPAAYLVDVLNWLDNRELPSGKTALDILFDGRRADIGAIELSCTNTNTPLPYIDLVNEALELNVAPPAQQLVYQTTGSAADLRAHPEYLHKEAYGVLAGAQAEEDGANDAVYPFSLPFNLWLEEARTYLDRLGLSRYKLMEAFQGKDKARTDPVVAAETLAMSPLEWDIIAGETLDPPRTVASFWGMAGDADFVDKLTQVSFLLHRASPPIAEHGMEFEELADLLRTDFVQAPATVGVWFNGQTCDTTKAELIGLTAPNLDRIHRFIRLRRRLGWSALDLDRAIQVLGGGTLDEACLLRMSHVRRLAADLHLPVADLLSWWGPLDTRRWKARLKPGIPPGAPSGVDGFGMVFDNQLAAQPEDGEDPSPYDRLFQTASTSAEPSDVFGVTASGNALADESRDLVDHLPAVVGALGVSAGDLAELLPLLDDEKLSLSNLSALFRHVSLARALSLRVRDLVSLFALTGIEAFDVAHTENALALLDEVSAIRESGFFIAQLDYLLRHRDTKPATLEPDDTDIGVLFLELGSILRKVEADHPLPEATATADQLRARLVSDLEALLETADVAKFLAVVDVDGEAGESPPDKADQVIDNLPAGIFDAADAKEKLVDESDAPPYLKDRGARLEYALGVVVAHLQRIAKDSAVIERMASAVNLDHAIAAPLLRKHLKHPDANGQPLLTVFSDDAVRADQKTEEGSDEPVLPGSADLSDQFAGFKRLHKAAILMNRFRVRKEELAWVLEQGPGRGTLDFQQLPVTSSAATVPYEGWSRLRNAIGLRDQSSPRELFDLFEVAAAAETDGTPAAITAAHESFLSELERRSRWDRDDIEFLVGTPVHSSALGFAYPQDWRDERPLERLAEVMAVVRRVGLPAGTLWPWRNIPLQSNGTPGEQKDAIDKQAAQAEEIKQAVRARHEETQWYEVARTIRDRLRERQRDALVGWLVGNDNRFDDANALFEHLLLDVEMSSCQLTSRIRQAMSSVQLFVQRILMGLEVDDNGNPLVELSKDDADEWEWRKNYRVWEANRKVFLYPENWIEPELRDNKTPLFKEFEDELLQGEITPEIAEAAVYDYLRNLDEIARLDIVGLCEQKGHGTDILHAFGRTRGAPPTYYHRQRINRIRWTPWEKVEAGIEGDHLIPVVFNGRLYIFWPLITISTLEERPQRIDDPSNPPQPELPKRYYEIRLAWSERRGDAWGPTTVARPFIGQDITTIGADAPIRDHRSSNIRDHREGGDPGSDIQQIQHIQKTSSSTSSDFFFQAFEAGDDLIIEPIRYFPQDRVNPNGPRGYIFLPRFRLIGCDGTVILEDTGGRRASVRGPRDTETVNQAFVRAEDGGPLTLPARDPITSQLSYVVTLQETRVPFEIVPLKLAGFESQGPFFYQDTQRAFLVEPHPLLGWVREADAWTAADRVVLDTFGNMPDRSPQPDVPAPDPWIYDPGAVASLLDAVIATTMSSDEPVVAGTALGLAAPPRDAVTEIFGTRVAFVGREAVQPISSSLTLAVGTRIVDASGRQLAEARTGLPPGDARKLRGLLVNRTFEMPALAVDSVALAPEVKPASRMRYRFESAYHPFLCTMMRELNRFGLDGLLDPAQDGPEPQLRRQRKEEDFFAPTYSPLAARRPFPKEKFDFSFGGSYAIYNWEVFFHIPFLIACQLNKNQRFADAQRWFHYILDPTATDGDGPQRFWKVRPLFELFNGENSESGPIHDLLLLLQYEGSEPEKLKQRDELMEQVAEWRANPFNPHAIARLRQAAYARAVVMKYIDNLIEWGDHLFRRDTMESINEATQLYILAAQMLGRRPRQVGVEPPRPSTFNALRGTLDQFSVSAIEEVEGLLPEITETDSDVHYDDVSVPGPTLFFCVPPNDKLLTDYWDRVADRLFKIRHCMDIEGIVRQPPLFEPPIDPALLVRAKALGVDLASAVSDLNAPPPSYRYQVLAQKATELCADVRGLGQALLSALEKKDAEELALLRSGHEVTLQSAVLEVRERQVGEARETLESLRRSRENARIRRDYYRSRAFVNAAEVNQLGFARDAGRLDASAQVVRLLDSIVSKAPNKTAGGAGFGGSPVLTFTFGGTQLSRSLNAAAEAARIGATILDRRAQRAGVKASLERRSDDWQLQGDIAEKEIAVLDRQIVGAEIRVAIARRELDNHKLQLEQSKDAEDFLRSKYTNDQLYQWMVGQLSSIYFQSYQLAYDMAKKAERAWQSELAIPDKTFIQFGYWDSLKKGLLAGERLHHDIKRMEVAYLDTNRREYELVRHVSLLELAPHAFLRLRQTGKCDFEVPEFWFDLDSPGHYLRRIKTVGVSIPSVTGPYTPLRCTLTLEKSSIRRSPSLNNNYERQDDNDSRFVDDFTSIESIVTSTGTNDSGMFETNLRDERYLPFENAGVIDSRWRLELPSNPAEGDPCLFDYDMIGDVILHISYTARDGGDALRKGAKNHVKGLIKSAQNAEPIGRVRFFSVRHDFPSEWARFQSHTPGTDQRFELAFTLREEHYPFWSRGRLNSVERVHLFVRSTEEPVPASLDVFGNVDTNDNTKKGTLSKDPGLGNLLGGSLTAGVPARPDGELRLFFNARTIADLWIAVTWSE
jgi:hypothetical protein